MFAVRGWADPKVVERYTHHWIAIGQAGRFFRLARAERCREAVFIGTLLRPALTQIRPDWQMLRLMPRIAAVFRGGDDRLLSGIAALFEEGGVRIIGVGEVAPEIVVPRGHARPSWAVAARSRRHRLRSQAHCRARPVRYRPGGGRRRRPCRCGRSRRRHRQYAHAGCAIAQRGKVHQAVRCRRARQSAQARTGPPLRPAGDRAENDRERRRARVSPGSRSPPAARSSPSPTR